MKLKKCLLYALLPVLALGCDGTPTTTNTTTTTTTTSSTPESEVYDFTQALALMDSYDVDAAVETVNTFVYTYDGSLFDYNYGSDYQEYYAENDFGRYSISQDFTPDQRYYEAYEITESGENTGAELLYVEYENEGVYVIDEKAVTKEDFDEYFLGKDSEGYLRYIIDTNFGILYNTLDGTNGKTADESGEIIWDSEYPVSSNITVEIEDGALTVDVVSTFTASATLSQTYTERYEVNANGLFSLYSINYGDYSNVETFEYNVALDKTFPTPTE